jgi:hypothetical protein
MIGTAIECAKTNSREEERERERGEHANTRCLSHANPFSSQKGEKDETYLVGVAVVSDARAA